MPCSCPAAALGSSLPPLLAHPSPHRTCLGNSLAVPLFGTNPGRCANQSSLETVHDKIHVTIGGPTGWMSDPTAAR